MVGSLKDMRSGVRTRRDIVRFVRSLESSFLMPLRKILFGVLSSIHEDAVFRSSVGDLSTVVSSLSRFADVIADSTSNIISTRYISVHPWGKYPTLIGPTCSKYTCQAYVPITCQKGFNQRCDHERLRLLWVERKRIAVEHMSDDVTMNYVFPSSNDALGIGSPAHSPRSSLPNEIEFCDDWIFC